MEIKTIESQLLKSNMYVICENDRHIIIDPCICNIDIDNVDYILLTHEHYDHISGVNYWVERTGARVIASSKCADACMDSRKNLSRYFKAFCELQTWIPVHNEVKNVDYTCNVDETYEKFYCMEWECHNIKFFESPGHSKGSSIIQIDDKIVFSGDSILEDIETECGLPGGNKTDWECISIPIIEQLSDDSIIYPGHYHAFEIKKYKQTVRR